MVQDAKTQAFDEKNLGGCGVGLGVSVYVGIWLWGSEIGRVKESV